MPDPTSSKVLQSYRIFNEKSDPGTPDAPSRGRNAEMLRITVVCGGSLRACWWGHPTSGVALLWRSRNGHSNPTFSPRAVRGSHNAADGFHAL